MKTFTLLLASALLIVAFMPISTADSEKIKDLEYSTTVKLDISATDEVKNQVYSYISRELRSLSDVKVVENDPNWTIQIVGGQVKNKLGENMGVALSVVILKRTYVVEGLLALSENVLQINLQELMEKKSFDLKKAFINLTSGLSDIRGHLLRVGSTEDMQNICKSIVADFDAEHLKVEREMFQKMLDFVSQYKSKKGTAKENNNKN